jgi:sugar lactone lactonase YvrE
MEFETVVTGHCLVEAPRWDGASLWYTDILLGGIYRLGPDGKEDSWLKARTIVGGLALNADGKVICSGTGSIAWVDPASGATGTLLGELGGKPINGVNDIFPDGHGGLWLGTVDHNGLRSGQLNFGQSELWHLAPDGTATRHFTGMSFSNGMGISPDGKTLYMNDSGTGTYAHDLNPDGSLASSRLLCDNPDVDGLAVDAEGGVWTAGIQSGDISRIMPDGTVERRVAIPGDHPVSMCFGGTDLRDLYVTAASQGAGAAVTSGPEVQAAVPRSAGVVRARCDVAGIAAERTSFKLG